ncbi:Endo-1-3(4)-beta-glucanase [Penicillium waksmanii]|uniref:Endo-1-3(4)-beta-glucanase n=1 Tax=Penicillium waksmanii TaxID=69791 RepID=UPI002549508D|nr:Endo-1-3(4)-beta-glucanase [Penicillium waksmanii]KAJ5980680.1 Endo-1-3(4)-beta-glucanase [Penicillium waksmanii]
MKSSCLSSGILPLASLSLLLYSTLVLSNPDLLINTTSIHPSNKVLHGCDCFTVSGPDPGYYQHYKLWDFREVSFDRRIDPILPPPDVEDVGDEEFADDDTESSPHEGGNQSMWFFETDFDKDWMSQQWDRPGNSKAPVDMINSKRNVFFTRNYELEDPHATYLVLRTTRHEHYTSTAEIETRVRNIYRCSLRVRLRILPASISVASPSNVSNDSSWQPSITALNNMPGTVTNSTTALIGGRPHPGACVGIFTYHARNSIPPYRIRYANQPDYDPVTDEMIPGASTVADLPVPWTRWSTHRLDWLSSASRWWVDDNIQDSKTYRVPNLQSRLVINLWSDGGVWTGDMALGDSIFLGIEYIELAYNRSSDGSRGIDIPPSQRHGGHQKSNDKLSISDIEDLEEESWEPDTDLVTGSTKKEKKKKCKKGRKGDKCRKKLPRPRPKKPSHHGPMESPCRRACYIDGENFRHDVFG